MARLMDEIRFTHRFLMRHKRGLPYADDPRALKPLSEEIRLQTDAQALGYLNLFELTGERLYRREAEARLDYIAALGDSVLSGWGLDGQVGYSFLRAYELTGNPAYLEHGLWIADRCLTYADNIMNWGYAAALDFGMAYRLTGRDAYREAARGITRATGLRQFPDGAFPHQGSKGFGENEQYTAWLLFEMIHHRRDDPENPDMDAQILKCGHFVEQRVNPDGSINYEDAKGSYFSDPGNADSRGWMNELPTLACALRALGRRQAADALLGFLFAHELTGVDRGGYPDKWGFPDPANPWATGSPSVLRTSLIFWLLTSTALVRSPELDGTSRACLITPADCNSAFREFGECESGLPGHDVCIDGAWTGCLDEDLVTYRAERCTTTVGCIYYADEDDSRVRTCVAWGGVKCVAGACSGSCLGEDAPVCDDYLVQGDACGEPGARTRDEGPPPEARAAGPGLALACIGPGAWRQGLVVLVELPSGDPARLELFDVSGRRVLQEELSAVAPGRRTLTLDGAARLPSGVYLARLTQGRRAATARAVVIR